MYRANSKGELTQPWGTPVLLTAVSERTELKVKVNKLYNNKLIKRHLLWSVWYHLTRKGSSSWCSLEAGCVVGSN